jgi:DNA polymerase-3 subunit delta
MALLYRNFRILMIASQLKQKSGAALAKAAGISPYQTKEYLEALNHFNLKKLARIMAYLREADLRSKGVGSRAPADQILKELLFKIFYQ